VIIAITTIIVIPLYNLILAITKPKINYFFRYPKILD